VVVLAVLPRVLAAVLMVALVSACTSRVGGLPAADPAVPEIPDEFTAEFAFDDLTTVAPCSLTDPEAFTDFGTLKFSTPESLDYCAIRINTDSAADVVISVGAFGVLSAQPELESKRVKEVDQGLWVGQQDSDPSFCSQLLVFPDGVTMQVAGSVYDGSANTCPMVEAGMDYAIDVILDRDVEHRDPENTSLLLIDPCDLVDDDDIGAIPGLAGVSTPNDYPGKHTCFWEQSPGSPLTVRVEFGAGAEPDVYGDATEGLVAGRQSVTTKYPDIGEHDYCAVQTGHIPFDEIEGEDAVETASVYVRVPTGQLAAACTAATAVAELVWAEIPSA
jgi:hypothetical protein